jgi:FkbM family methyltransferase
MNSIKFDLTKIKYYFSRILALVKPRQVFYLGGYQSITKLVTGQVFFVDTSDISLAPSLILHGQWEPGMTKVFTKTVKSGMTFIDIGSHMGYYTVLAGSCVGTTGRIFAFEANPKIFETLFKNVFVNGLLGTTKIENKAVYSHSTKLKFNTLKRASGGNSIVEFSDAYKDMYKEEIQSFELDAISLDDYFSELPKKVDVMKIDAEGSEPYVFDGMKELIKNNDKLTIFCEFDMGLISGARSSPKEFLEKIVSWGFRIQKIQSDSNVVDVSIEELLSLGRGDLLLSK